jgi:hypothetical protein
MAAIGISYVRWHKRFARQAKRKAMAPKDLKKNHELFADVSHNTK